VVPRVEIFVGKRGGGKRKRILTNLYKTYRDSLTAPEIAGAWSKYFLRQGRGLKRVGGPQTEKEQGVLYVRYDHYAHRTPEEIREGVTEVGM